MPSKKAQKMARNALKSISLEQISLHRAPECSVMDIFYTLFIRATMSQQKSIIIQMPSDIMDTLKSIHEFLRVIGSLKHNKDIFILDIYENKNYYKGSLCSTIKLDSQ